MVHEGLVEGTHENTETLGVKSIWNEPFKSQTGDKAFPPEPYLAMKALIASPLSRQSRKPDNWTEDLRNPPATWIKLGDSNPRQPQHVGP